MCIEGFRVNVPGLTFFSPYWYPFYFEIKKNKNSFHSMWLTLTSTTFSARTNKLKLIVRKHYAKKDSFLSSLCCTSFCMHTDSLHPLCQKQHPYLLLITLHYPFYFNDEGVEAFIRLFCNIKSTKPEYIWHLYSDTNICDIW